MKFFLVKTDGQEEVLWLRTTGEVDPKDGPEYESAGGYLYSEYEFEVLEEIEAKSFGELDKTKSSFVIPWEPDGLNSGWLDREGIFYGCTIQGHLDQADQVHGHSEGELEEMGWVKISAMEPLSEDKPWESRIISSGHRSQKDGKIIRLTPLQERWLVEHGFNPDDAGFF